MSKRKAKKAKRQNNASKKKQTPARPEYSPLPWAFFTVVCGLTLLVVALLIRGASDIPEQADADKQSTQKAAPRSKPTRQQPTPPQPIPPEQAPSTGRALPNETATPAAQIGSEKYTDGLVEPVPQEKKLLSLRASGAFRPDEVETQQPLGDTDALAFFPPKPMWIDAPPGTPANAGLWWNSVSNDLQAKMTQRDGVSNISPEDYAGPDACKECHEQNHSLWSHHAHRWMNAWANEESMRGDFSGSDNARIEYMGGVATFYQEEGKYLMRLIKEEQERLYQVKRTIGSRFYQYYAGVLLEGPDPANHPSRTVDYVLPFGYWIDQQRWVPLVHVDGHVELDGDRDDPFVTACRAEYDGTCGICHTTKPAGDWILSRGGSMRARAHSPRQVGFLASAYVEKNRPEILEKVGRPAPQSKSELPKFAMEVLKPFSNLPAPDYTVCLGVSCESCHNGSKFHVEDKENLPRFYLTGDEVYAEGETAEQTWGKTPANVNWTCARCHSGDRPRFAGGADTWNSTEFSDAARGFCYADLDHATTGDSLTCIHCHEPHTTIGKKWSRTPQEDNASCIACHEQFNDPAAVAAHTHHLPDGRGSDCMGCHMPKINEGLQDVVRTHRICNPTEAAMIEANQPNACNLCHVDENIDWTLKHLQDWYGASFDEEKIAKAYPHREVPATMGWLGSKHPPTRLAAIDAVALSGTPWGRYAIHLLLDDPAILNRQFAQMRLESEYDVPIEKEFGYRFYMTKEERAKVLPAIREALK